MQYSKADLTDPDEREAFYAEGSDRAIAILLGAVVENRLTAVMRSKWVADVPPKITKFLLRAGGPLGSLGVKNYVCYVFGFIPVFLYNEIEVVVTIRNMFAHQLEIKDFTSPEVTTELKKLATMQVVHNVTRMNPPGTRHVSGIQFGNSALNDYRLCVAHYISQLRLLERGAPYEVTGPWYSYFDT